LVPTLHDWIGLAAADVPSIAPDGRSVAYVVVTPDWESDTFDREIWLGASDGTSRRALTTGTGSSWNARWCLDGKALAFLSSRTGSPQVFLLRLPGDTPEQLTDVKEGVDDFRWSPDGRRIAFLTGEVLAEAAPEPKEFHVVGNDPRRSVALWMMEIGRKAPSASPPVRLTDPAALVADSIAWSPDSRRIVLHASEPGAPYEFWTYDLYVVDVAKRSARKIVEAPGPEFFPVWSPDGTQVVYRTYTTASGEEYRTYSMGVLAIVSAEGGLSRIVTGDFDEQATPLVWTPEGIYFSARERTFQHLFRLDPATGTIDRLTEPFESLSFGFSFTPNGRTVACVRADATHFQEIFVSPLRSPLAPRRLTFFGEQLADWALASREIVSWTSSDGTPIEGVLLKPAGFDAGKRYPLVVIVHGGPVDADQATISRDMPYAAEMYAAKGALVLRPNYRGSAGYGRRFRAALTRSLGAKEYEDIVSGVDHLVSLGLVDAGRVGLMGWSHGGYLAAFAATFGKRFAAVSSGAGVSDLQTFYTLGAGATIRPSADEPTPWDAPDYYRAASPLTYVKRAATPTLIQHGERDDTAPIASAHELHRALRDQGVPVRMIVYRGAGHVPGGLRQFEAVARHNLEWFGHWLWNEPLPPDR
jgi:dipeptidyl aminopeptidase/acylaminoacyl peptidase